jgi:RNA polymerase sigma factor (sigma-70 family)
LEGDLEGQRDFDEFCMSAYPRLVAALGHIVENRCLAEELAQEAMIRAYLRWDRVATLRSPVGWTVHVGTNLARSALRRRMVRWRAERCLGIDVPGGAPDEVVAQVTVQEALAHLSLPQREAVVLRYLLGLSASEAGEVLGIDANAVRQRTHRALTSLRRNLAHQLLTEGPTRDPR